MKSNRYRRTLSVYLNEGGLGAAPPNIELGFIKRGRGGVLVRARKRWVWVAPRALRHRLTRPSTQTSLPPSDVRCTFEASSSLPPSLPPSLPLFLPVRAPSILHVLLDFQMSRRPSSASAAEHTARLAPRLIEICSTSLGECSLYVH